MRRFIFPATAELQHRVFLFLSFLFLTAVEGPSLRCCVPLCAARPGPLTARLRRRHTRSEKSGCQAPPRKQEALGGWRGVGGVMVNSGTAQLPGSKPAELMMEGGGSGRVIPVAGGRGGFAHFLSGCVKAYFRHFHSLSLQFAGVYPQIWSSLDIIASACVTKRRRRASKNWKSAPGLNYRRVDPDDLWLNIKH